QCIRHHRGEGGRDTGLDGRNTAQERQAGFAGVVCVLREWAGKGRDLCPLHPEQALPEHGRDLCNAGRVRERRGYSTPDTLGKCCYGLTGWVPPLWLTN